MSDLPIPLAGPSSQDGDVVVTRNSRYTVRNTVRQRPGVALFSALSRNEVVRLAPSFTQRHAVDVWGSENGSDHLLETY